VSTATTSNNDSNSNNNVIINTSNDGSPSKSGSGKKKVPISPNKSEQVHKLQQQQLAQLKQAAQQSKNNDGTNNYNLVSNRSDNDLQNLVPTADNTSAVEPLQQGEQIEKTVTDTSAQQDQPQPSQGGDAPISNANTTITTGESSLVDNEKTTTASIEVPTVATITQLTETNAKQLLLRVNEQQRNSLRVKILTFCCKPIFAIILFGALFCIHTGIFLVDAFALNYGPVCSHVGWEQYWILAHILVPIGIYVIIYFLSLLALIIGRYRDTWSMRTEVILMPIYWIPIGIVFGFTWWFEVIEAKFPTAFFLWFAAYVDLTIGVFFPIVRSFLMANKKSTSVVSNAELQSTTAVDSKAATQKCKDDEIGDGEGNVENNEDPKLRKALNSEPIRKAFLKFCTNSLCPENLLFWIDVKHKFEINPIASDRLQLAKLLMRQYIHAGSLMELNLDGKAKRIGAKQVTDAINAAEAIDPSQAVEIPQLIFTPLIVHVEQDLLDSFSRFVRTDEYYKLTSGGKGANDKRNKARRKSVIQKIKSSVM